MRLLGATKVLGLDMKMISPEALVNGASVHGGKALQWPVTPTPLPSPQNGLLCIPVYSEGVEHINKFPRPAR